MENFKDSKDFFSQSGKSVEINLVKFVLNFLSQLQLKIAAFFLTTAMIVDGMVLTSSPVKAGNVAMTTPTTAI